MRVQKTTTSILLMLLLGQVSYASAQTPNSASRAITILKENCLSCHGGQKMSGLDMRSRETLFAGGKHGKALVAGKPDQSLLYRFVAGKEKIQMPPGKPLPQADIAVLKEWIAGGANWTGGKQAESIHWSFRPVVRPSLPNVKKTGNPVDSFILAKLQAKGLPLSPRADKRTLIRRAYFDLWGMPPTPQEVQAFVSDTSPKAWENLIDRLLASPHYGERWARHWLDISRYAESNGFKTDEARPNAWRYRDYVIQALNADTPFDRFLKEQIAGDELYPDSLSAKIATGFNTHFPDESNAQDLRMRRQDILNDITDTVGSALLGVTLGCARCHDHKYDPISQKDYYRIQSFFAGVRLREDMVLLSPQAHNDWKQRQEAWEQKTERIRARLTVLEEPVRKTFFESRKSRFPKDVQDSIDTPAPKRTSLQRLLYFKALPQLEMTEGDVASGMNGTKPAIKAEWKDLNKKMEQFRSIKPEPLPLAQGINDVGREVPTTHLLAGGSHNKPLEEVKPAFLSVLTTTPPRIQPPHETTSGRRIALAEWLASPQNPLTTRVIVNRVWHYHFGRGIVATPNDFGKTGELPTHPELLDWLTSEFVRKGWSLKQLHRLLMTSATYQQSSRQNPNLARKDPENHLFGRYMRRRVEGEVLRDSLLSVSGELDLTVGGKSVMPPLPADVTTRGYWKDATNPKERNRRSVYIFVKRNLRYPFFAAFDMPDTHDVCARRQVTITPLQSLLLLNEETVLQSARAFASRVLKEAQGDPKAQIEAVWQHAFQRAPSSTEAQGAHNFLLRQTEIIAQRLARKERLLVPEGLPTGMTSAQGAALVDLCHALYNSNEFVTWE